MCSVPKPKTAEVQKRSPVFAHNPFLDSPADTGRSSLVIGFTGRDSTTKRTSTSSAGGTVARSSGSSGGPSRYRPIINIQDRTPKPLPSGNESHGGPPARNPGSAGKNLL